MKHGLFLKQMLTASTFLLADTQAWAQDPSIQLAPIIISGDGATDNTSGSVLVKSNRSATKTLTPAAEIPQSITTISRKQIDDQNPQTVGEALRYTAGVLSDRDSNS